MRLRTSHGDSPICGEASLFFYNQGVVIYVIKPKAF